MSPEEFKAARLKLGLSMRQTAHIFDVDISTMKRWETQTAAVKTKVNPTAARAMRWMLDGFRPPEWPDIPAAGKGGRRPKEGG